jgi:hypothetical protein
MQKARIRTGWKKKGKSISVKEFANALSVICWRIALNAAKNLHEQDFIYDTDEQRIRVIREYLFFFIHCSDRLMYEQVDEHGRKEFVTALAKDGCRHYAQNSSEILGDTLPTWLEKDQTVNEDYIVKLNETMGALAGFKFEESLPGFEMFRLLGARIQDVMGSSQTNRWVIDHVMQIDGPEGYELFKKSFDKLKRSSGF